MYNLLVVVVVALNTLLRRTRQAVCAIPIRKNAKMLVHLCFLAFVILVNSAPNAESNKPRLCNVSGLAEEILSYEPVVKNIIDYVVNGAYKGKTYQEWVLLALIKSLLMKSFHKLGFVFRYKKVTLFRESIIILWIRFSMDSVDTIQTHHVV